MNKLMVTSDDTVISFSNENGRKMFYLEKVDEKHFYKRAILVYPRLTVFSNYGFSKEDLKEYRKIIKRKFPTV